MSSDVCEQLLHYLDKTPSVNTIDLAGHIKEDHQTVIGAVKSLQSLGDVITVEPQSSKLWELTSEGRLVADKGSYEFHIFSAIAPDRGIPQDELMNGAAPEFKVGINGRSQTKPSDQQHRPAQFPLAKNPEVTWPGIEPKNVENFKVGFSKAMSSGWVMVDKSSGSSVVHRKVNTVVDTVCEDLRQIRDGFESQVAENFKQEYKKRKLLQQVVNGRWGQLCDLYSPEAWVGDPERFVLTTQVCRKYGVSLLAEADGCHEEVHGSLQVKKSYLLGKGVNFSTSVTKPETDLTPEMIATGSWRQKVFKPYNLDAMGVPPESGHLHPLLKVRAQFRQIFLEMG
ncbi:hypothetical protein PR048_029684 [Dryococelus australis]|uniref:Uncharacterized protein n=1 Tax=Dryococelus australis TaxID=614101 RepID=A0ABQ9GGG9_9NEOP|nr:hypothetical protein PR048_029684 [Dryococelus australis]